MASPATMSRIRSNGSSDASSRRPTTRVIVNRKANMTTARIARSISRRPGSWEEALSWKYAASRKHRHFTVDRHQVCVPIPQFDVLVVMPDGRGVDLELHEENELLARGDVPELERQLPVGAALTDG